VGKSEKIQDVKLRWNPLKVSQFCMLRLKSTYVDVTAVYIR
jgi:hypothetical protein